MDFLTEDRRAGASKTIPFGGQKIRSTLSLALQDLPETVLARTDEGIVFVSLEGANPQGPTDEDGWAPCDLRIEGGRERPVTLLKLEAGVQAPSLESLGSLDWVLLVVDPSFHSVGLAAEIGERLVQLEKEAWAGTANSESAPGYDPHARAIGDDPHPGLAAVLNHIPDPATEQFFVTAISRQAHIQPIGAIREDWEVGEAGLEGRRIPSHKAEDRVRKIVDRIEKAELQSLEEAQESP
jgi:MinD-like ATPase involved in chromosome partitioning or flagellar assembly